MFRHFLERMKSLNWSKTTLQRAPAPDHRVFAIGDVHGRADLLTRLIDKIESERLATDLIIFLGDYIDRGPASKEVVDIILDLHRQNPDNVVCLKGNHEATLLNFLDDAQVGQNWANYGGLETLLSYGVPSPTKRTDPKAWEDCQNAFKHALSESHVQFYKSLSSCYEAGCYLFVHAGVDPQKPTLEQSEQEYLWIRDRFLEDDEPLEHIIVHGHTPAPHPYKDKRRIGLDTGAYSTGILTAAKISGLDVEFITS